jgi:hypothetical protein
MPLRLISPQEVERLREQEARQGTDLVVWNRAGTDFGRSPGATTPRSSAGPTSEPTAATTPPVPSATEQDESPTT